MKEKDDVPIEKQIFRYWVELRDLRGGSVRELPVTFYRRILLVSKKKGEAADTPPELRISVQDDGRVFEARDREDLSRQLREVYPDGSFERTMKCERDRAAEERYNDAIKGFIEIIAEAVVEDMLAEEASKAAE